MIVLKFGGTSVANAENIKKVKTILTKESSKDKIVVVVSAFGGITDLLLQTIQKAIDRDQSYTEDLQFIAKRHRETIRQLFPETYRNTIINKTEEEFNQLRKKYDGIFLLGDVTPRVYDKIISFGELLSSYIISEYLKIDNTDVAYKDARTLIKTRKQSDRVMVDFDMTNANCYAYFKATAQRIVIVPGFIASSVEGETTTLGRGGSDYTAAIIASAVNASLLIIWTDVSGMFTADPKLVKQAHTIHKISYVEAMELSHFGAKVLYLPSVQPVMLKDIPIHIKNTFKPEEEGTIIVKNFNEKTYPVRGISHVDDISLLTLEGSGMVGIPGVSKRLFEVLYKEEINVVLITQASSEYSICIGIAKKEVTRAKTVIDEIFQYEITLKKLKPAVVEHDLAIIAIVGNNMKSHQGLSGKMFSTLGNNNVNIRAIAQGASERNISAVIDKNDVKKALNVLHEHFFEDHVKQLNLFITGVGNVGEKFLNQIYRQKKFLKEQLKLNVRVIAVSNSRKMVFDEEGINLAHWKERLANGENASGAAFFDTVKKYNLRNSIFVDNTASSEVSALYERYLKNSIPVVTCNKIACASAYKNYIHLKKLSGTYNASFLFETNVGAGLPVIDTLKNLIASGDRVTKIEAVLSGSLNFIFNNFDEHHSFHDVVQRAKDEGYTEPDPRIDLSGIDVARKILILARESGYALEIEDIENNSFLPEECLKSSSVDEFLMLLNTHEAHFRNLYNNAKQQNCRLKYVASFKNGNANTELRQIPEDHPFYNLEGKDNIVLFYTERYSEQPLLIKGAGAGADVTASGIFADIIRIGKV